MQLNALHVGAKCNLRLVAPQLNANFQHTHTVKTKEKHTYKSYGGWWGEANRIHFHSWIPMQCTDQNAHAHLHMYIHMCLVLSYQAHTSQKLEQFLETRKQRIFITCNSITLTVFMLLN